MTTFQPGQLVYAASGGAYRYICPVNSAHAVHPIFQFGDDDDEHDESQEELGHPEVLHAVFASPPREKLDIELEHLKQLITAKQAELLELQKAMRVEMSQDRKQALEAHSTLVFIADWLLGKELWAVTRAYSTYVVRCVKNGKDGMALHVYRKKTGQPQFVVFDGLGSEREVISIHQTEAAADEALRAFYEAQLAAYVRVGTAVTSDLLDLVKHASQHNVQIPAPIAKAVTEYKAQKAREEIKATEEGIAEAKKRLDLLKEKL
jgi:hypothetical protein